MCLPLAVVGVAMAASAAISIYGQVQAGKAAKEANNAQAAQNEIFAAETRDEAAQDAEKIRRGGKAIASSSRAAFAGSGVRLDDGGTSDLIEKRIIEESEEDAYMTILSGERKARSAQSQAGLYRDAGRNAVTASYLAAGSTALGAAASYSRWSQGMNAAGGR